MGHHLLCIGRANSGARKLTPSASSGKS